MSKHANPDHAVHELIAKRWSPYSFSDKAVSKEDLRSLFEAARWAASSYNEQPWAYIIATKEQPEEYQKLLSCLVEPNQAWAKNAPVLVLAVIFNNFNRNGQPNKCALHDLGLASGNLTLEATHRGLSVHQMAGILPDKARELYQIPEEAAPAIALAIGYATAPENLEGDLKQRDTATRTRKPLNEFVFSGQWKQQADML